MANAKSTARPSRGQSRNASGRGNVVARSGKPRNSAVYPVYRSVSGFPMQKVVTLPYAMEMLTSSAGFSTQTFRTIDMHDPDYTGGGHQCRGWDQYKVFYRYYRVLSVLARSRFSWEETPSQSQAVGMYIDDDATFDYSNTNDLYEKCGPTRVKLLTPDRNAVVRISMLANISKLTGGALDNVRSLCTGSPTETGPYIHVWAVPNNTGTLTYGGVRVHIQLEYTVELMEPLAVGGS